MNTMRMSVPAKLVSSLLLVALIAISCFFFLRPGKSTKSGTQYYDGVNEGPEAKHDDDDHHHHDHNHNFQDNIRDSTADDHRPKTKEIEKSASPPAASSSDSAAGAGRASRPLVDVRSDGCRRRHYKGYTSKYTTCLIVDLSSKTDVDRFKATVHSLLDGSEQFVSELIVAADSDTDTSRLTDVRAFLKSLSISAHAQLVNNAGKGVIAARIEAYKQSRSEVVVFSDTSVVGTFGWLRPLISALLTGAQSIVMPHYDDATNPNVFVSTSDRTLPRYTWPLTSRIMENLSVMPTTHGLYRSPTVHANIFAVRRSFFGEIGGYDGRFASDAAAAHMELSLRSWMCGGSVLVVACSHVGVRKVLDPVRVSDKESVGLIGDLWFGDRKNILLTTSGFEAESAATRSKSRHVGPGTCSDDIDAYFRDIARVPVPTADAAHFGQLQANTDRCAHAHHEDSRIDLSNCWPAGRLNLTSMVFELTARGRLMTGNGRCLTVQPNSYIIIDTCTRTLWEQQGWTYDGRHLVNPWSNFCAMHVTDPENSASGHRQIVMAQNCTADLVRNVIIAAGDHQFLGWKFINV